MAFRVFHPFSATDTLLREPLERLINSCIRSITDNEGREANVFIYGTNEDRIRRVLDEALHRTMCTTTNLELITVSPEQMTEHNFNLLTLDTAVTRFRDERQVILISQNQTLEHFTTFLMLGYVEAFRRTGARVHVLCSVVLQPMVEVEDGLLMGFETRVFVPATHDERAWIQASPRGRSPVLQNGDEAAAPGQVPNQRVMYPHLQENNGSSRPEVVFKRHDSSCRASQVRGGSLREQQVGDEVGTRGGTLLQSNNGSLGTNPKRPVETKTELEDPPIEATAVIVDEKKDFPKDIGIFCNILGYLAHMFASIFD